MNRLTFSLFTIAMYLTSASCLQKKQVQVINWSIAGTLPASPGQSRALGFAGPVAGVHHDALMVAGGANFPDSMPWMGGRKKYYDDVYVYLKRAGKVALHKKVFKLSATNSYAACCSTPQGVFYAGGENEYGIGSNASLMQWDPAAENIGFKSLPDLPVAVTNAAACVIGNVVFVAGGETATVTTNGFYSLDLNNISEGWKQLPSVPRAVSHSVLISQSNGEDTCIYLVGGRKKNINGISDIYAFMYEYDLGKKQWKEKKSLPYNLCAATGVANGSGYLLLFGGDKAETFHKVEMYIAAINAEKNEVVKQQLIQKKNQLQAASLGFSNEVLQYNTVTNEWTTIGNISFNVPVTTTAFKWGKGIVIPTGEIKPGVRTPQILLGRMEVSE